MSDRDNITLLRKHIDYAVHALEHFNKDAPDPLVSEIIHHLRTHLAAEPTKQEPGLAELARQMKPLDADMAAILHDNLDSLYKVVYPLRDLPLGTLLYTAPPDAEALRRDAERLREALAWAYNLRHLRGHSDPVVIPERFAPLIEAALRREET